MPARLHHERIARSDVAPAHWMILTHGIYGAGSNWRGIARKVNAVRGDWGVVLVDLRLHGRSESGEPPHTVDACADDLCALVDELVRDGIDIRVVAGHSFGGKVAMAAREKLARRAVDIAQTWALDASPSPRPGAIDDASNSVVAVLDLMRQLPRQWQRRDDFIAALVDRGHALPFAQWLAMNVVPEAGSYVLRLDLEALHALLDDYFRTDRWEALVRPEGGDVELVVADRSPMFDAADRERLLSVPSHVHVHRVDAGHWLHIEAPEPVVQLLVTQLPTMLAG